MQSRAAGGREAGRRGIISAYKVQVKCGHCGHTWSAELQPGEEETSNWPALFKLAGQFNLLFEGQHSCGAGHGMQISFGEPRG